MHTQQFSLTIPINFINLNYLFRKVQKLPSYCNEYPCKIHIRYEKSNGNDEPYLFKISQDYVLEWSVNRNGSMITVGLQGWKGCLPYNWWANKFYGEMVWRERVPFSLQLQERDYIACYKTLCIECIHSGRSVLLVESFFFCYEPWVSCDFDWIYVEEFRFW